MPFVPAPELGWTLSPVYSNKRKHDEEETMNQQSEDVAPFKRLCQQQQFTAESQQMEESEINHNTTMFPNQNNHLYNNTTIQPQDLHDCLKDIVSLPSQQCVHNNTPETNRSSQNDMIMELCDETYSNTTLEKESYLDCMDNDYVPDSQQYIPESKKASCNNCVGDRSPGASSVRCYCKPTWEHMMDLRPYISDYY